MHAIAYDAVHDEIVVPNQFAQAVLTFRGGASSEEPPLRVIQGPHTQLADLSRLDVDSINNEIFVPLGESILVFKRESNGDVPPLREISGPQTQLGASAVAVDSLHNVLMVASSRGALLSFDRNASGNAAPRTVIRGPRSRLKNPNLMVLYPPKSFVAVGVRGSGPETLATTDGFIGVWSIHDNGDVPPRWTVGGPNGVLQQIRGVALDPKNQSVLVSDKRLNAVLTFYFPEMF